MAQQPDLNNNLVISYLGLRRAIGILGIALPFVLAIGEILHRGSGIEGSISSYYHTGMRDVFVGCLCAIGIFLMSYRGYDRDHIAGIFGGICAVGVALFPMAGEADHTSHAHVIGVLHYVFAALLFLTLAFFCLILFTKTGPENTPTPQKRQRNFVYKICGITILICIVLVPATRLLPGDSPVGSIGPVFWLEALAIVSFGVSWMVKGETILRDAAT